MSLSLVTELNDRDRALLDRVTRGFLPARIYHIHTHLFHTRHFAEGKRPAYLDPDRGYGLASPTRLTASAAFLHGIFPFLASTHRPSPWPWCLLILPLTWIIVILSSGKSPISQP